jgi:hypothetical protein
VLGRIIKTKLPVFALSLALAFLFWLAASSADQTSHDVDVRLEVALPDESKMVLVSPIIDKITLTVEANPARFKLIESRRLVYRRDLSSAPMGPGVLDLSLEDLKADLDIPRSISITRVQPDQISYDFDEIVSKKVPIELILTDEFDPNTRSSGQPSVEISEVTVTGPSARVERITSVPLRASRRKATPGRPFQASVDLASFDRTIKFSPQNFVVNLPVEWRRTHLTRNVPVTLADPSLLGDAYSVTINPSSVDLSLSWPANRDIDEVMASGGLKATINVTEEDLERARGLTLLVNPVLPYDDITVNPNGLSPRRVYVTFKRLEPSEREAGSPEPTDGNGGDIVLPLADPKPSGPPPPASGSASSAPSSAGN